MFNQDFFPTPIHVIESMLSGVQVQDRVILEPSAGSGNIIDVLKAFGAKNVLACELHPDLAIIAANKADRFLMPDFLEVEIQDIAHVQLIIMNPPFSADDKHILHAWEVAPDGCEIIALCNSETLTNHFSKRRKQLVKLVNDYGYSKHLGPVFENAERETGVKVALVRLQKPCSNKDFEFDGYFDGVDTDPVDTGEGVLTYNSIRDIVNRYVASVKMFDEVIETSSRINAMMGPLVSGSFSIRFGAYHCDKRYSRDISRDEFKKELQKSAWRAVFNKMNMERFVTSSVLQEINAFVEMQETVPFTMSNVYKMIDVVFGTHSGRMKRILVEAFDKICSYSPENSQAGESWKTNSDYKVNQKFIIPYIVELNYSGGVGLRHGEYRQIDDLLKAFCFLTGKQFDKMVSIWDFFYRTPVVDARGRKLNKKGEVAAYDFDVAWNDIFQIRAYKKGTMHFKFIDLGLWEEFNIVVGKLKGWKIPQKTDSRKKGTEKSKSKALTLF